MHVTLARFIAFRIIFLNFCVFTFYMYCLCSVGIPAKMCRAFKNGFPDNWKELLCQFLCVKDSSIHGLDHIFSQMDCIVREQFVSAR